MDSIQQDVVYHTFNTSKKVSMSEFFLKTYDKEKGDKDLQKKINKYIDEKKSQILPLLKNKQVYVMRSDGEPAGKKIELPEEKASVLFHFRRNEDNTHYFPTIKHREEKVEFQYNNSQVVCTNPAWLLVKEDKIVTFKKGVDGNKIKPFLNKKFIVIPKKVEETYYRNFVTQLVANFSVYAKGFEIRDEHYTPSSILAFNVLESDTFENQKVHFVLRAKYGNFTFDCNGSENSSVKLEKNEDEYVFHKVKRITSWEVEQEDLLRDTKLPLEEGECIIDKAEAFQWLDANRENLEEQGFSIVQSDESNQKYFLGKAVINIEVTENQDWFDIYALVKFGEFEIPFIKLKDLILSKKREFTLPNGEIAVIPYEWLIQYSELFAFSEETNGQVVLKKHHLALLQELEKGNRAKLSIKQKLEGLQDFEKIQDFDLPNNFLCELRPYQKAGYNWLQFLHKYNFGGCLADDMGLGKTIQTLALLQYQKEQDTTNASLLIMPTSLVYNWQVEAKKFAPDLKVLVYMGTYRDKNTEQFKDYDIIITSYGIARIDVDLLKKYHFHYIILDESQAIKNPNANISKAVKELNSSYRLILTGTPIENSTMDLWSQMSFVNPGLLGTQKFFKESFMTAIEKKNDLSKKKKLHSIIKPFILRRKKSQVLTELPEKLEQIWYSEMTKEQEKEYEEVKSFYRNQILEEIDVKGMNKSQIILLQGLTKLRQIANHPLLVDEKYEHKSGKGDDVLTMLDDAMRNNHKILVFSQFVKHLGIFKDKLEEKGVDYAYLDGGTKNRQQQVEYFQQNKNVRIFLISLKAGGLGLNLTA
ncbi:MAG: DEAD/DEAH box helicase, partial [Cytophagales bacterium]|nr:DEAD/DEAH box helicase [Cytophagales bacterium]